MANHPDYIFLNEGSIWLCVPQTREAREHLQTHVQSDAQWFGRALVVEHRYVQDLAANLETDGFTCEV